jgi:hypothetical protein
MIPMAKAVGTWRNHMNKELKHVKVGLALVLCGLLFGVVMGITFGVNEDVYKNFITEGIAANPQVHDAKSPDKIWRYAQRAHFHATGIAAFCLALIPLVILSDLKPKLKTASSVALGLSSLYPLSWLTMFVLAPSIGRGAAHSHVLTETFAYIGVGGLLLGCFLLLANLFLRLFRENAPMSHSLRIKEKALI